MYKNYYFSWAKSCRLGYGEKGISDRVILVYMVFVAATLNLTVTVKGHNREHFDTEPALEILMKLLIMEVET